MSGAREIHVLVVGAGIVGLLVAQGLKKNGIPFCMFESEASASHYRPREWGMSLQWALPMLPKLLPDELLEKLQSAAVDPHYVFPETGNSMPAYNAETGELMKDVPLVKMLRVSRRKMRTLCAEGIDVQYGKALQSIDFASDDTVTARFIDGSTVTGTLLVGADGANSAVRTSTFPGVEGKAQQVPFGGVNMHVCYSNADIAHFIRKSLSPIQAIGSHPRGYWLWLSVQDVPDPDKPEDWVFQLQWTWKLGPETEGLAEFNLEKLKEEARQCFGEPFRTAWLSIPEGTRVPNNKISAWHPVAVPDHGHNGRAVLVGDAAHAMSFHRGQGMNHGINDAVTLVDALVEAAHGTKTQQEAVMEYEAEMISRAGEEVKISKMNTEMVHDWNRVVHSPWMQRGGDKNK